MDTMITNRQWRLRRRPEPGEIPGTGHFDFTAEACPKAGAGQVLVRTLVLGTSPAQRGYISTSRSMHDKVPVGGVMRGRGVGVVVDSHHDAFAPGDLLTASLGWQDYAAITPTAESMSIMNIARLARPVKPSSLHLGLLGGAGATAYFGLLDVGLAKPGETVVISAAAGGIGSLTGQIAKIAGCRVVGICGSDEKCTWITRDLKFDAAINYRTQDIDARLRELCPGGVDVYFDNVGGDTLNTVLDHLARRARVVICGWISTDYASGPQTGPANYKNLLRQRARMEGFYVFDYLARWGDAESRLRAWYEAGRIDPCEDLDDGLEKMPETLASLFKGTNKGVKMNRVAPDPV
ncbi:MAG: NADP-dependent oxidoreductase [Sinobacteraceae bacterium]|nr:NADP-dependent oxidoreductase [Nevskiaceae bacterium]MCP5467184.1 NADP-dependent oxidoreductase [Nevskiaceae bacterium]